MRLVYSVRGADDVIYADELGDDAVAHLHARAAGGLGRAHRPDRRRADRRRRPRRSGTAFVCGSNGFVETAGELLLAAGLDSGRVRTERFGPTGF